MNLAVDSYDLVSGLGKKHIIVLANGVFDLLHAGHVDHLIEARTMGDKLFVSLTSDDFVKKGPGRPINNWFDRARVLSALRCVDKVYPTQSAVSAILRLKPDIFVKGIDYASGDKFSEDIAKACREVGAEIRYTKSPKQSATDMIRKALGPDTRSSYVWPADTD